MSVCILPMEDITPRPGPGPDPGPILPEWRSTRSQSNSQNDSRSQPGRRDFCWSHSYHKRGYTDSSYRAVPEPRGNTVYHYAKKSQSVPIQQPDSSSPLSSPEAIAQIKDPGTVQLRRVGDIDWRLLRPFRAGVIMYEKTAPTFDGNAIAPTFCLGVDASSGEITDFGGGISYRKDKTTLLGALREFAEESHGVFGTFTPEKIQNCMAIYNNAMMIIFIPTQTTESHDVITQRFRNELTARSESCDLTWLQVDDIQQLCEGKKVSADGGLRSRCMYHRVRDLLNGVPLTDIVNSLSP